jgi:transposase
MNKKHQHESSNSEIRAEQVTNSTIKTAPASTSHEAIYLGVDLHKKSITVTRIIDHGRPQPAQTFSWEKFFAFARKQLPLAKKVYAVYEAGAFGFWPARQLQQMGIDCYVVHPEKLDPHHKRVQTDKLDSRNLADKLQRYVRGNNKAMVVVYIPSPAEEQARIEARHRKHLKKELQSLQARGRGLLLSQGIFEARTWWQEPVWERLQPQLCSQLTAALEDQRALIQELEQRLKKADKNLEATAPKELPQGFGALTYVLLQRELCNYQRFQNRRNVGGFTGLCGGVSSSGPYHLDLSINKAGNPYLRTLLIELAWRMIYWQPKYTGLKTWKRLLQDGKIKNKRLRKMALVAVARQLAVDIWRWQTGRVRPEQLGWGMRG